LYQVTDEKLQPARGQVARPGESRPESRTGWYAALLHAAIIGALSLSWPDVTTAGPGPCITAGTTVTCTGDQSAGIVSGTDFLAPPVTTLNVNSLTANITPASGFPGISFQNLGDVTINSNTGSYGITVTGANASGIGAYSNFGNVAINNTGKITTLGAGSTGIDTGATIGAITITNTGMISGGGDNSVGINADGTHGFVNASTISVVNYGTVTETGIGSNAVAIASNSGLASFFNGATGVVAANGNNSVGVLVATCTDPSSSDCAPSPFAGNVDVHSLGRIQATGANSYGIFAAAFGGGNININLGEGSVTLGGSGAKTFGLSPMGLFTGAAAIAILGGSGTTLTNAGTITGASGQAILVVEGTYPFGSFVGANTAISNTATGLIIGDITLGAGNDTITNAGALTGNVDKGGGVNVLNNLAGGTFNTGPSVNLGAGNTLTNAGTLSPGRSGRDPDYGADR